MYPRKTRPREKPSKSLLEKICIMKISTIMNHALDLLRSIQLATQNKETLGLDKSQAQTPNLNPNKALDPE